MALKRDDVGSYARPRPVCDLCDQVSLCWFRGAHVCERHYIATIQAEADEFCASNGLRTLEQKIGYFRKQYRQLASGRKDYRAWMRNPKSRIAREYADAVLRESRNVLREPGEDDEAMAA